MNRDVQTGRPPRLRMRGIRKCFPGVLALDGVDLQVEAGAVHALMGENGAGKSTLMKVLSGACRADAGSIEIDGVPEPIARPLDALRAGISIVYQELSLAPNLAVYENIFLGHELRALGFVRDDAAMRVAAQALLARLGCAFGADARVASLAPADRQLVEIARSLLHRAKILVLDEPTTSLSERETEKLFGLIDTLRAEGLAVIYISHRMDEVYRLADRVTVLRDGRCVGTLERAALSPAALIRMMVGRELGEFLQPQPPPAAGRQVAIEFRDYADRGARRVKGCSFAIHRGEVLGLAGLVGAGRTELARLIFGVDPRASGTALVAGVPLRIERPADAIAAGIAYLPEDRRHDGLFLEMTVAENLTLNAIAAGSKLGVLDRPRDAALARQLIEQLAIKLPEPGVAAKTLSGGNQQKVLLGRWLALQPRLLILDEATRGVDIGAKREIYALIRALAAGGVAVLMISSELNEVVGLCDRVLVMREGRIAGAIDPARGDVLSEEAVLHLAFHAHAA